MRIGLIADTHDNATRTRQALERLEEHGAELLLHAGDLNTDATVPLLDGWRVWLVEGNVDRPGEIREAIREHKVDVRYDAVHEIEAEGTRIGLIHGDDGARLEGMINSGVFDLVVHGHSHAFRDERIGPTRVVNPGAVHRAKTPSVCTFDTESGELERIALER